MKEWTGQDYLSGNSTRRETNRQTEETMGWQHQRVDWPRLSFREQYKERDEQADRGNDGTATSKSGLAKTIFQGTVQGGRRTGRQRKRWDGNIKEWTGQDYLSGNSTRRETNRQTEETMGRQHQRVDWPRLSFREQYKEGDEEVDRGNDGTKTSKSGLALNGTSYSRKLRTVRSGGSWLQNLQWFPNSQPDYGISEEEKSYSDEDTKGSHHAAKCKLPKIP